MGVLLDLWAGLLVHIWPGRTRWMVGRSTRQRGYQIGVAARVVGMAVWCWGLTAKGGCSWALVCKGTHGRFGEGSAAVRGEKLD